MTLTPIQKQALARYRSLRDRPLNALSLLVRAVPYFAAAVAIAALCSVLPVPTEWASLIWGVVAGATLREIRYAQYAARVLPALFGVIDWARLDAALADSEAREGPGPRFRLD